MFVSRGPNTRVVPTLLTAGIAGPIWFTALVIVQGILQPDYSHIAMPISALAASPAAARGVGGVVPVHHRDCDKRAACRA